MKKRNWIIFIIVLVAFWLRIWKINQVPHGFNADEAAIGYNIYSLLQTGKDEHGNPWPLHFQSFNDYKPGGYFYLALPFVKILGLTELAVRLPSILAGTLSVYLVCLLVKELIPSSKHHLLANLSALLLAISPWHIEFSRGGWETNLATTFLILGSWLFLRGIRLASFKILILSLVSLVASAYVYHSLRIIAPLLLLSLIFLNRRSFFAHQKKILIFLTTGIIITVPLLISLWQGGAIARFSGVGIIGDVGPFWSANRLRGEHEQSANQPWVRILHNRPLAYLVKTGQNWASHFDGEFLFIDGDKIRRSHCPGMGEFYYLDFFLCLLGFYFIFKNKEKRFVFPIFWLLVAPIPAALTLQSPHALRSHSMVIPFLLICAYGLGQICKTLVKKKTLLLLFSFLIVLVFLWQLAYFLNLYLVHYPVKAPQVWEYGMGELVEYLKPIQDQYKKIYITDRYDQPYILFLFYLKYPPEKFQEEYILTKRDRFGFSTVRDFSNFHFEAIDWEKLKIEKNILVIGADEEIPNEANVIKRIFYENQKPAFEIAEL